MQHNEVMITEENRKDFYQLSCQYRKGIKVVGNEGRISDQCINLLANLQTDTGGEAYENFMLIGEIMKVLLNNPDIMQKFPSYCKNDIGSLLAGLQSFMLNVSDNDLLTGAIESDIRESEDISNDADYPVANVFMSLRKEYYETDHMAQKAKLAHNFNNQIINEYENNLGLSRRLQTA